MQIKQSKILSINIIGKRQTYDITTKKNHNFFANNILVHNCFQEQLMNVLVVIGNFSMSEADKMRKILKFFKSAAKTNNENEKQLTVLLDKFRNNAIKIKGIEKENIELLIDKMAKYSEYLFNKCLSGDTNVITENGIKKIKDFTGGENVISYNFEKNKIYTTKVKKLHKNGKKLLYSIKTIQGNEIKCTLNHKFMTESGKMETLKSIIKNKLKIVSIL